MRPAGEAVRLYTDPGDKPSRQLGGILAREFARQAPEAFAGQAAQVGLRSPNQVQPTFCCDTGDS